jgi:excisionase family DNA binding protein
MLTYKDQEIIRDMRAEYKIKFLEQIFKEFIKEAIDEFKEELQKKEDDKKPLLTIEDIARRFKVTKATIHNWINRGMLKGRKVGKNRYFMEDEVRHALMKYGFTKQWENQLND